MRQLAELDEATRSAAFECYAVLRPHLEQGRALAPLARAAGVTLRTARRWVNQYRAHGLAGLARARRTDGGTWRSVPPDLLRLAEGLALQRPVLSIAAIHREVAVWAGANGQPVPSYETVRRIVRRLPAPLVTLGCGGDKAYRDAYDLVLRREAAGPNALWQADHTQLDLVARRDDGREGRPWLTVITDDYSRAVMGFAFAFEAPSALRTSLALRQAIWRKGEAHWAVCGIPAALYSDNGSDFTSEHLQQVAADLKIRLVHSIPGVPRGRGKIERFFRTVNQRFLCHLPGYCRGGRRRPGELQTLPALDQRFREFLREYHQTRHSETKQAPLERWRAGGFLPQMPDSLEQLDLLLLTVARERIIRSDGVHFAGHRYMDSVLGAYVGERVILRYDPRDVAEIRLFHRGRFLCRAIAPELAGEVVALKEIVGARNRQRRALRHELKNRQEVVERLLELRRGEAGPARSSQPSATVRLGATVPAKRRIKLYRND